MLHISTTLTQTFNVLLWLVSAPSNLLPPLSVYILASSLQHSSRQLSPLPVSSSYSCSLVISTQIQDNPIVCMSLSANIRSMNNKYPAIAKFIFDNDTDLFAMSETWIRPDITCANLSEITPPGYNLHQQPREGCRGGGLGFFVKDGLDSSVVPTKTCTTFENFLIKISLHKASFYFLNIYRPPSSSTSTFF